MSIKNRQTKVAPVDDLLTELRICGQVAVAVLSGRTLEFVCAIVGHEKPTKTRDLVAALKNWATAALVLVAFRRAYFSLQRKVHFWRKFAEHGFATKNATGIGSL